MTMRLEDQRGYDISGASARDSDAFEGLLKSHLSWQVGIETGLQRLIADAPRFTMAHVLEAYLGLCSRDVARVQRARLAVARAGALPANHRESLHVRAIRAALEDDFITFGSYLQGLLDQYPRDVLALQVSHAFDYLMGDIETMQARIAGVLPNWSEHVPGFHAVLAMEAFSLVEATRYEEAKDRGLRALSLMPGDARAHHALVHVCEMKGDTYGGNRLMSERRSFWADSNARTHCWWHWALFHLAEGALTEALGVYEQRLRQKPSVELADLIDSSALLWRLALLEVDAGLHWRELANAWIPHIDDGYCTFNDMHAMVALVGAQDWKSAARLETGLLRSAMQPTRYGETTRVVGLPVCRATIAFGNEHYARATEHLSTIPAVAHRMGGSRAQRDLLYLTLMEAVRRLRRPGGRVAA
jgi:tetratricopeptide (TPR) repeat protein